MKFSIDQNPPSSAEIEAEKSRIETEINSLNRREKRIDCCLGFVGIVFVLGIIPCVCYPIYDRAITDMLPADALIYPLTVFLIGSFLIHVVEGALMMLFSKKQNTKIREFKSFLSLIVPIDAIKSNEVDLIELCATYPEINNYYLKVTALNRSLMKLELKIIQDWVAALPGRQTQEIG
jgi:hypothetical protein